MAIVIAKNVNNIYAKSYTFNYVEYKFTKGLVKS